MVRLKVPLSGPIEFEDKLRGKVTRDAKEIDDQVLLKSDGMPTYHLANVVDDHLMEITHVIRAEEWISSTPKHVLLYQAFGWEEPAWHHMPLLRNADKSKISKRKNPVSINYYRDAGILPHALLNFLALAHVTVELIRRNNPMFGSPLAEPVILCGQHSLNIFCLGIFLSVLGHFVLSEFGSSVSYQISVSVAGVVVMFVTAYFLSWSKQRRRPAAGRRNEVVNLLERRPLGLQELETDQVPLRSGRRHDRRHVADARLDRRRAGVVDQPNAVRQIGRAHV